MKTFVLMTRMSPQDADIVEVAAKLRRRARHEARWIKAIKEKCPEVNFLAHYALLGKWDFMDIYEAPDEEAAAKISILSRTWGADKIESWVAIPNSRLTEILDELEECLPDMELEEETDDK